MSRRGSVIYPVATTTVCRYVYSCCQEGNMILHELKGEACVWESQTGVSKNHFYDHWDKLSSP